jgi:hypothetical protein
MTNIQAKPDRQMLLQWLQHTQTQWIWEKIAELKEREKDGNLEAKYFPPMTFNDYSKRIDEARTQVKLGQVTSLEDFEKEVKGWQ